MSILLSVTADSRIFLSKKVVDYLVNSNKCYTFAHAKRK